MCKNVSESLEGETNFIFINRHSQLDFMVSVLRIIVILEKSSFVYVRDIMVMNLYRAFSIDIFKCALQASDLWTKTRPQHHNITTRLGDRFREHLRDVERNDTPDTSKPVARHFNLPNHSKQHMAICGLSLHFSIPSDEGLTLETSVF